MKAVKYLRVLAALVLIGVGLCIAVRRGALEQIMGSADTTVGAVAESGGRRVGPAGHTAHSKGRSLRVHRPHRQHSHFYRNIHEVNIRALALSMHGKYLATGAGMPVKLWDVTSRKLLHQLQGSVGRPDAMAFTADEAALVVLGDGDRALDVWDVSAGTLLFSENLEQHVAAAGETFQLRVEVGDSAESSLIQVSPAAFEHVQDKDSVYGMRDEESGVPWKLQDTVSGQFVKAYNDGWTDPEQTEPAKGLSWNPGGRYSAYGEGNSVLVWKLSPTGQ